MSDTLENRENITGAAVVQVIELGISEGFQAPLLLEERGLDLSRTESPGGKVNIFDRPVVLSSATDLSFILGLASTGLRTGAFVSGKDLIGNYNQLSTAARQHLALVIHTDPGDIIAETGCFHLVASNPQEAADFALIAHRIAELSLIPGINIIDADDEQEIELPLKEDIIKFLGDPDEHINCPTPSQQMIFGKNRRRIPNWFNLDHPTLNGTLKDGQAMAFESAANRKYFYDHLPELIEQAFTEYNEVTGRSYAPVAAYKASDAGHLILTQGATYHKVISVVEGMRNNRVGAGCLNLSMLYPFPEEDLLNLLKGKKSITVLESVNACQSGSAPIYNELLAALQGSGNTVKVYSGRYGSALTEGDIIAVFSNMTGGEGKQKYYLGIDFTRDSSKYPKHEILLQNISRKYPGIEKETLKGDSSPSPSFDSAQDDRRGEEEGINLDLPHTIRQYKDQGPAYTKLSRFYDDTAYFYRSGEEGELVADPFQAIPVVPSATANFADMVNLRETVPQFIPQNCTGCGECFVNCPHSSIPPVAIGLENLINAGVEIANAKGAMIAQLTPVIKNLAKLAGKAMKENREHITKAGDFLPDVFDDLAKQMKLEGEKLKAIRSDFNAVMEIIKNFPVSVTEPFFDQPETQEKGSGEIFSLAIDPHACTGCGVCVKVCDDEALKMTEQTLETVAAMQSDFQLWEQLPGTSVDTINRLHDTHYNSFAAILLSRSCYMTMTGGSRSESGSPAKALMHLVTAATEAAVQPKVIEQIKEIEELISKLSKNIHSKLSEALPKEDFEGLEKAMWEAGSGKLPFDEIVGKLGDKELMKIVDTQIIHRRIELVKALKDLRWALTEGPTGTGRSNYGMAIAGAGSMLWAKEYPYNTFTSPIAIQWDGAAPELAMGLFKGQLRYLLDNIKLMRRAKLEARDKYDPDVHDAEIASLSWKDLDDEEKALIPPVLLVGDKSAMNERNWGGLSRLLSGEYPVKVVIVDNALVPPGADPATCIAQSTTTVLSAMALKNAYVLQGSMGNPAHLFNGLLEGMQCQRPALFCLFAPDHEKHFIASDAWPKLAPLALNTRAFPALQFDPADESGFFCSAIHLEANPTADAPWHIEQLTYTNGEEEQTLEYAITWADWANTLIEWKEHFNPFKEGDGTPLPVADYITLDESARNGNVPVIIREKEGALLRYAVSRQVVAATEAALAAWNMFREIAGTLTQFPDKLRKLVEKELSEKHGEELAQAKADFEKQLKEQEQVQVEAIRQKLKDKLLTLAKQVNPN